MDITLAEYNRRFDLIIDAFRTGHFTYNEASAAMQELTRQVIRHIMPKEHTHGDTRLEG